MSIIENFAALSEKELMEFATTLIEKINSEGTFTAELKFEIANLSAEDLTGELAIDVSPDDPIHVSREASWQAESEDEADSDPGYEAEYVDSINNDAKKVFKTTTAVIDGYKVTLDVYDADEADTVEVTVDDISHEDSGIGDYEYWGSRGHDSNPYVEVRGTIVKECYLGIVLYVEPAEEAIEDEEDFDNAKDGDFDPDERRDEMPWDHSKHFDD